MENVNELAAALAKAQGAYKPITKNCTGNVTYAAKDGRPGGSYKFEYADLQAVIEATRKALSDNGLCHFATINESILTVTLLHSSGQSLSASLAMPSPGEIGWQKYGSAVTYARRYLLTPLLGVASEDDDDANNAEGNTLQKTEKAKTEPTAPLPMKEEDPIKAAKVKALYTALSTAKMPEENRKAWMAEVIDVPKVLSSKDLTIAHLDLLIAAANALASKVRAAGEPK